MQYIVDICWLFLLKSVRWDQLHYCPASNVPSTKPELAERFETCAQIRFPKYCQFSRNISNSEPIIIIVMLATQQIRFRQFFKIKIFEYFDNLLNFAED